MEPYHFKGMPDFVPKGGLKPSFVPKVATAWFVARVGDALSQIPASRPEHRAGMYATARESIAALQACVTTAVDAFDEVMKNCPPLDDPDDPPVPAADPFTATRPAKAASDPIPADDAGGPAEPTKAPVKPADPFGKKKGG